MINMIIQSGTTEDSALLSERIAEAFFCGTGDTCEANINYYIRKKRADIMSGILMMVIAIVVLGGAYLL